jgi:hypothetical protein
MHRFAILIALVLLTSASAHATEPTPPVLRDTAIVIGNGSPGPYWLSGYFILADTDTITASGNAASNYVDYTVDPNRGRITFDDPLSPQDTVLVIFDRLTWRIPTEITLSAPAPDAQLASYSSPDAANSRFTPVNDGGSVPSMSATPRRDAARNAITWRGFKSFSVTSTTGRGTEWSQGMELAVDGELSRGLNLRAAISDRFAGVQPLGRRSSASRLGDLDRLFIEIEGDRFYGRMGQLSPSNSSNSEPARQLTGARLRWNNNAHTIGSFIGRASGQMVRQRIPVTPLVAGPYRLGDNAGGVGNVLPGSVTLYLDGRRLREGGDRDYTFDPTQGAITFNPEIVLAPGSVVVAEFERALDSYRRNLAGADWTWRGVTSSNALQLHYEADDPNQPMIGSFTDAQRRALATDPDGVVTIPAAEYRGNREGDYTLKISDSGDSVFTYVGPDQGEWQVAFEYVGPGNGRYRHLADNAYEYVGPSSGSYEPSLTFGAPVSHVTIGEKLKLDARAAGVIEGQWLGHVDDTNRFAPSSTEYRSEHHLSWTLYTQPDDRNSSDRLQLEWRRHGEITDRGVTADNLARFSDLWGLSATRFDDSRNEYQVALRSAPDRPLQTDLESAVLSFDDLQAWRIALSTTSQLTSQLTATTEWREAIANREVLQMHAGNRKRELGSRLTYTLGSTAITSGWSEHRLSDSIHVFAFSPEYTSERFFEIQRRGIIAKYRWDDTRDSAFAERRRTREASLVLPLSFHEAARGRLTAARGEMSHGDSPYEPYYRGGLNAQWSPFGGTATITTDMRLDYTRSAVEREVFLPTRPGEGQYRLERGEYVPDAYGDYRRVVSRDDDLGASSYDGRQKLAISWRPTIAGWRWTLESRRERIGQYTTTQFRPATWLTPWTSVDWALVPGARAERHDYHRLNARPTRGTELTLDWQSDVTVFGLDRDRNTRDRVGATARRQVTPRWYAQAATDYEKRSRTGGSLSSVSASAITHRATVGGAPVSGVNWSLEGRRRTDRERLNNQNIRLLGIKARLQIARGPFNILLDNDAAWVGEQSHLVTVSALLAEGRPIGFSLMEFCEARWQLPGKLTLKSRVTGDIRERSPNRWRWEIQTVAQF